MVTGWRAPLVMVAPTGASSVSSRASLTIGLTQRDGLATPDQAPGPGIGVLTVLEGDVTGADGRFPPVGGLDEAPRPGRQVMHHFGQAQVQVLVVDEVEVRLVAGNDGAAVLEPIEMRRVTRHLLDHEFERQAVGTIPGPVAEHVGRRTGVTDDAAVGTAI